MTATAEGGAILPGRGGVFGALSDLFWRRPKLLIFLLLLPALLWLGIVYVGSLLALLLQSFFYIDDFSGMVVHEFTLRTYAELFRAQNVDIIVRTVAMAAAVTIASARRRVPHRLHGGALCPRASGKRCSISASCCRCGRAISSRSTPGS